jgi:transposase-like protein
MTDTNLVDEVLKTDRLGRVRTPVERREALLDEYERSGMSGQAFAGHYGIKYQTLASWVQKRRRERAGREAVEKAGGNLRLVEAVIERKADSQGAALVVGLPGGARVEVSHGGQVVLVAALLRALEEGRTRPC